MSLYNLDINETLLGAMQILIDANISKIGYDKTLVYTVKDDKDKKSGKYTVTDGEVEFIAISDKEEYKIDDQVYVTITQGDYSKDKVIIGKKKPEDTVEVNYINPIDQIVPVKKFANEQPQSVLVAPGEEKRIGYYSWSNRDIENEFTRILLDFNVNNHFKNYNIVKGDYNINFNFILGSDVLLQGYKDNSNIIDFVQELYETNEKTNTERKEVVEGENFEFLEYIYKSFKDCNTTLELKKYLKFYNHIEKNEDKQLVLHTLTIPASELIGNIYGYQGALKQNFIRDISSLKNVIGCHITCEVLNNFEFQSLTGNLIPLTSYDSTFGVEISGINLFFGYGQEEFSGDNILKLITNDAIEFNPSDTQLNNNSKLVNGRWIKYNKDKEKYECIVESWDEENQRYILHEAIEGDILEDCDKYRINWYYEKLDLTYDTIGGAYWKLLRTSRVAKDINEIEALYEAENETNKDFNFKVQLMEKIYGDQLMSLYEQNIYKDILEDEEKLLSKYQKRLCSYLSTIYTPVTSKNSIGFKGVLYELGEEETTTVLATSEPLMFLNWKEQENQEYSDFIMTLEDEQSFYFYNEDCCATNEAQSTKIRTIEVKLPTTQEIETLSILWKLPLRNSMVKCPMVLEYLKKDVNGDYYNTTEDILKSYVNADFFKYYKNFSDLNANDLIADIYYAYDTFYISYYYDKEVDTLEDLKRICKQSFSIQNYYDISASNNVIACELEINNKILGKGYKSLEFGISSTAGTDYNFSLYYTETSKKFFDASSTDYANDPENPFYPPLPYVIVKPQLFSNVLELDETLVNSALRNIKYSVVSQLENGYTFLTLKDKNADSDNYEDNICYVGYQEQSGQNYIEYLQAEIVYNNTTLTAVLPIPVRHYGEFSGVSAPVHINYSSQGEKISYSSAPLALYGRLGDTIAKEKREYYWKEKENVERTNIIDETSTAQIYQDLRVQSVTKKWYRIKGVGIMPSTLASMKGNANGDGGDEIERLDNSEFVINERYRLACAYQSPLVPLYDIEEFHSERDIHREKEFTLKRIEPIDPNYVDLIVEFDGDSLPSNATSRTYWFITPVLRNSLNMVGDSITLINREQRIYTLASSGTTLSECIPVNKEVFYTFEELNKEIINNWSPITDDRTLYFSASKDNKNINTINLSVYEKNEENEYYISPDSSWGWPGQDNDEKKYLYRYLPFVLTDDETNKLSQFTQRDQYRLRQNNYETVKVIQYGGNYYLYPQSNLSRLKDLMKNKIESNDNEVKQKIKNNIENNLSGWDELDDMLKDFNQWPKIIKRCYLTLSKEDKSSVFLPFTFDFDTEITDNGYKVNFTGNQSPPISGNYLYYIQIPYFDLYKDIIKLKLESIENAEWRIITSKSDKESDITASSIEEDNILVLAGSPSLIKEKKEGEIKPDIYLRPSPIYTQNSWYSLQSLTYNAENESYEAVWTQPLIIKQNLYQSETLNKWTGYVDINNENNYIMSQSIGAGSKTQDNKFSGILMGKVEEGIDDTGAKHGLFGFSNGAQSFGFREDGTAFIGAAGKGRINFDGEESTIVSSGFENNAGVKLDLDDGLISVKIKEKNSGDAGLKLQYKGKELIKFTKDKQIIQSYNSNGINLNFTEGLMSSNNFSLVAGYANSNYLSIDSKSTTYPISIGLAQTSNDIEGDIALDNTNIAYGVSWEGDVIGKNLDLFNDLSLEGRITFKNDDDLFTIYKTNSEKVPIINLKFTFSNNETGTNDTEYYTIYQNIHGTVNSSGSFLYYTCYTIEPNYKEGGMHNGIVLDAMKKMVVFTDTLNNTKTTYTLVWPGSLTFQSRKYYNVLFVGGLVEYNSTNKTFGVPYKTASHRFRNFYYNVVSKAQMEAKSNRHIVGGANYMDAGTLLVYQGAMRLTENEFVGAIKRTTSDAAGSGVPKNVFHICGTKEMSRRADTGGIWAVLSWGTDGSYYRYKRTRISHKNQQTNTFAQILLSQYGDNTAQYQYQLLQSLFIPLQNIKNYLIENDQIEITEIQGKIANADLAKTPRKQAFLTQNNNNSTDKDLTSTYQNLTNKKSIIYNPNKFVPDGESGAGTIKNGDITILYPFYKSYDNEYLGTIFSLIGELAEAKDFTYTYTIGGVGAANPYAFNFECSYDDEKGDRQTDYFRIGALGTVEATDIAVTGDIKINGVSLKSKLGIT